MASNDVNWTLHISERIRRVEDDVASLRAEVRQLLSVLRERIIRLEDDRPPPVQVGSAPTSSESPRPISAKGLSPS